MDQKFTVTHNNKSYNFVYEPQPEGLVWLIENNDGIESKNNFGQVKPALNLEHAKDIALQMLKGMGY